LQSPVDQIAAEIEHYCVAHPEARDTLEGILWWLHVQRDEEFRESVRQAVEGLVARGRLERRQMQDGSLVFGSKRAFARDSS
jgi:hypothetical protein